MSNNSKPDHGSLEIRKHLSLLVDLILPFASRSWVTSDQEIRLETHLSLVLSTVLGKGRLNFTGVVCSSWETDTRKENFEEDLGIEL